jgi:cytoskeletal protein CcmA (bactofilin family)
MKMTDSPNYLKDDLQHSILKGDIKLTGDLFFSGKLHIFGSITGNIISNANANSYLILEEGSEVNGEIRAANILVRSHINGNIFSFNHLSLKSTAVIQGNIHYNQMEVNQGSTINGNLATIDVT